MSSPTGQPLTEEPAPESEPAADRRRWLALAVVLVGAVMDLLDMTIVNVAVPSIQKDLNAGYSAIEWVTAGYALSFAAVLITGGRLGDIFGRKRLFLIGMGGFTLASALCGVAISPGMLIGSRVLQGGMAALMVPQVLAIIHVSFPPEERGKVFGLYSSIGGLGVVLGPILGGVFVQADLFGWAWRPIFLINVPVGVIGMAAAVLFVRESTSSDAPRLDLVGAVLATSAVLLLVYPLTEGRDLGWPAWGFAMMAGSLLALAVFVAYERRLIARGGTPLIVLSLFKARSFAGGFSVNLLFNIAFGTFFLMWSLYLQIGMGWSALHTGLTGISFFLGLAAGAGTAVQFLTPKFGRKVLFAGGLSLILGAFLLILTSSHYGTGLRSWEVGPPLVFMGLGMGLIVAPVLDFALTEVPSEAAGSASGVLSMTQQVGSAIGIALVSVVFLTALGGQAGRGVDKVEPAIQRQLTAAAVPAPAQKATIQGFRRCVKAKAKEKDPTVTPAACRTASSPTVTRILMAQAPTAQAQMFSVTVRRGLGVVIGLLAVVLLLMFSLPRFARPQEH